MEKKGLFDHVHAQWFGDADGQNGEEQTAEHAEEKETVTAEQFQEMQDRYEQILKAQSGSDKKVKELMDELKQEREDKEKNKKTSEQRLIELEQKWREAERATERAEMKNYANQLLSAENIKTKFIDKLLGSTKEETEENVKDFIEEQKALKASVADEFARLHGRKVTDSSGEGGLLTKEQIQERIKSDPSWYTKNKDLVEKSIKDLAGG